MAMVYGPDGRFLLDAGIHSLRDDFPVESLSAIVLTHFHPDHVMGLFLWRWSHGPPLSVFCPPDLEGCADLFKNPGIFRFRPMPAFQSFSVAGVEITPVPLAHSKLTHGYAITDGSTRMAYLTDTDGIPAKTSTFLRDFSPQLIVLDCSFFHESRPGRNHNDLDACMAVGALFPTANIILTHLSHDIETAVMENTLTLPPQISLAMDGRNVK